MNKSKVIETLRKAQGLNTPIDTLSLYSRDTGAYCLVGWLAHEAGVETLDLIRISTEKFMGTPFYKNFKKALKNHYDITDNERNSLYRINDGQENLSWKKLIEVLQDE